MIRRKAQVAILIISMLASCKKDDIKNARNDQRASCVLPSKTHKVRQRDKKTNTRLKEIFDGLETNPHLDSKDLKLAYRELRELSRVDFKQYLELLSLFRDERVEYNSIRKECSAFTVAQLLLAYHHAQNMKNRAKRYGVRRVLVFELIKKNPSAVVSLINKSEGDSQRSYLLNTLGSNAELEYLINSPFDETLSHNDLKIVSRAAYSKLTKLPQRELGLLLREGKLPNYLIKNAITAYAAVASRDGETLERVLDGIPNDYHAKITETWLIHTSQKNPLRAIETLKFLDSSKVKKSLIIPYIANNYATKDIIGAIDWVSSLENQDGKDSALSLVFLKWLRTDAPNAGYYVEAMPHGRNRDIAAREIVRYFIQHKDFEAAYEWIKTIKNKDIKKSINTDYNFYLNK